VRDHRGNPDRGNTIVRDHRNGAPTVVRDHRNGEPTVVRDHRTDAPSAAAPPAAAPSKPDSTVRDHRKSPVVRDHRKSPVVRDHRTSAHWIAPNASGARVRSHRTSMIVRDRRTLSAGTMRSVNDHRMYRAGNGYRRQ
jgi:hypothetical protein